MYLDFGVWWVENRVAGSVEGVLSSDPELHQAGAGKGASKSQTKGMSSGGMAMRGRSKAMVA
jgi:hypothetical protein